jgi:hypothetical protein
MRLLLTAPVLAILVTVVGTANAYTNLYVGPDQGLRLLYVQGTASVFTSSGTPVLIPGMQLTLPARTKGAKSALVTFNAPRASFSENNAQCNFGIYSASAEYASGFKYGWTIPITLVTRIPLFSSPRLLQVEWNVAYPGNPSDSCSIDTFYSLSAILTAD